MSHFINLQRNIFLLPLSLIFIIWLFCTPKQNPVTPPPVVEVTQTPTLSIISPANDTLVANATDSITVKAFIENSSFVDTLKINGINLYPMPIVSDTLLIKFPLTTDTTKIIIAISFQQTKTIHDSITIIKTPPVITTSGMAKISGTLLQESSGTLAKKLSKALIAQNAQGVKSQVSSVIPISGADVMVYNSQTLSTSSDTVIQTDSLGNWSVELNPGNYFVFAVYFDRINLEIVTTALPDIEAEKDKETKTDSAVAVSDDVKPMLMSFLDAAEVSGDNIFLPSATPAGFSIVMSFSESMTRVSIGDSIHGIILGTVNADSSDLPLLDTIAVKKLWGPAGKELRLIPMKPLVAGLTYKVVIPSGCKDLALNKLDKSYIAIVEVTTALALPPFSIKSTSPLNGDTIQAGMSVECIFTRPVDGISLNKNVLFIDSLTTGFFEIKGNIARFINKRPFAAGSKHSLLIKKGVKDLLGDSLGTDTTITFFTQPKDTFEQKIGIEGTVALYVKKFMGAFVAGNLENFAKSFHTSFEFVNADESGTTSRIQLAPFLEMMRSDIEERNRLSKYGIIAPVFYYPVVNGSRLITWKLKKGTTELYFEDMGPGGAIGKIPRVISIDNRDISDSVTFVNRGIVYNGETLYFAPDMSKAFLDGDTRQNDPGIFGKLLKAGTNVETQDIMLNIKQSYVLRNLAASEGSDTANVVIELTTEEHYLDGKRPGPIANPDTPPPDVEKRVEALQTKLLQTSSNWLVLQMSVKNLFEGDKAAFKQDTIKNTAFVIQNFEQTRPVNFLSPKHKSIGISSPIILKWSVLKKDGIGGYLVAIANEPSGGNQGLLIYTRNDSVVINSNGSVEGGTILSIDPKTITVPIPHFNSKLTSFTVSDSDVYVWKVIALADTTITTISAGGNIQVIADSDFGNHGGGLGIFTLLATMPNISITLSQAVMPNNQENRFADRDGDLYPDWIEKAYGTSPDDPGSSPNFTLDSDLDGTPDFLELFAGSNPEDPASKPTDTSPADKIPDMLQNRPEWRPELAKDDDNDGFPNEIEMLFGTDPWKAESKPSKSIKASVPTNTYFGGLKLGDQKWKRINFALISDTTGNFALIDTTELQGIAKNGVNLSVKLQWLNGEWVFFLKLVDGPNTGKFIKVRFHNESNNLRGLVDLADMENGGGPYIGEFFASLDTIKDFNNLGANNPNNNTLINNNPDGPLNLGPPPMDRVKRPDSGSVDIKLQLSFTENGVVQLTMHIKDGDSLTVPNPFWNPTQSPALGFNLPESPKQYRLDGNLHRIGNPQSGNDSLVLIGMIEFNKDDGKGGFFKQKYDYIVFITGVTDPKKPAGTWNGWYTQPMGPVNQGPLPYIGSKDSVMAALALTGNMAIIMGSTTTTTIDSVAQKGTVWIAMVDTNKYFIMEKMGDFASVMYKYINGKPFMVISNNGPGGNGNGPINPQPGSIRFTGDSTMIISALLASSNNVKINAPSPLVIQVNPATLKRESDQSDASKFQWVVFDATNPQRKCILLGIDGNPAQLRIEENNPVANEIMQQQNNIQQVPFTGDSTSIIAALTTSLKVVKIASQNPLSVTVNLASIKKEPIPGDTMKSQWTAIDINNQQRKLIFLAASASPAQLLLEGTTPLVKEIIIQQPINNRGPFTGDSSTIAAALSASSNIVKTDATSKMIPINPATLHKESDSGSASNVIWVATAADNPLVKVIFLANSQTPAQLALDGTTPLVKEMIQQNNPNKMLFIGDSASIVTALTTSANIIRIDALTPFTVTVNPASLRKEIPGGDNLKTQWIITDATNAQRRYFFLAQNNNTQLFIDQNMPVALEITQQPVVNQIPFTGDSTIIVAALVTSSNKVMLDAPGDSSSGQIDVDPATLKRMGDDADTTKSGYAVSRVGAPTDIFIFKGQAQSPSTLLLKGAIPIVFKIVNKPVTNP